MPPLRSIARRLWHAATGCLFYFDDDAPCRTCIAFRALFVLMVCVIVLNLCACHPISRGNPEMPAPGYVEAVRIVTTADGTTTTETVKVAAPQASTTGTPVSLPWGGAWWAGTYQGSPKEISGTSNPPARIEVGFSGSQDIAGITEAGAKSDQSAEKWIFYGLSAGVLILGGFLVGIGKHFKLGGICLLVSVTLAGLGVAVIKFPFVLLASIGCLVVSVAAFFGWFLWRDYKEDGILGNKPFSAPS